MEIDAIHAYCANSKEQTAKSTEYTNEKTSWRLEAEGQDEDIENNQEMTDFRFQNLESRM